MARDPGSTWVEDGAPVGAADAGLRRYEEREELGRGGLGRVVAAFDRVLGREVARKDLLSQGGSQARRFEREARITARLEHPNIVPVHDAGRDEQGAPFYTMRLIRGQSLQDAIDDAGDLSERLQLLEHFVHVCNAVAFAHAQGVVHRDLKPENVMLGRYGETWLVDWGLAFVGSLLDDDTDDAGEESPDARFTRVGGIVGTPAWMAPEQARGQGADARTDIWGLGALLYALLTGKTPYSGTLDEVMDAAAAGRWTPLEDHGSQAPAALQAIVRQAMAASPADRYATVDALSADVKAWQAGLRVRAYEYSPAEAIQLVVRRYRRILGAIGVAAVLLTSLAVWTNARIKAEAHRTAVALSGSLTSSAVARVHTGELDLAEVLAAEALTLAPSPAARGVLAASYGTARPMLVDALSVVGGCRSLVSDGAGRLACGGLERAVVFDGSDRVFEHPRSLQVTQLLGNQLLGNQPTLISVDLDGGADRPLSALQDSWGTLSPGGIHLASQEGNQLLVDGRHVASCLQRAATFSWSGPDRVVAACLDGAIWVLGVGDEPARLVRQERAARYSVVATRRDTAWVSSSNGAQEIDLVTGEVTRDLPGSGALSVSLALSPGGRWLAGGADDGVVTVWDLTSDSVIARISGHGYPYAAVAWVGADRLATGGGGVDWIRIWEVPALSPPRRPLEHGPVQMWPQVDQSRLHHVAERHHRMLDLATLRPLPDPSDVDGVLAVLPLGERLARVLNSGRVELLDPVSLQVTSSLTVPLQVSRAVARGDGLMLMDQGTRGVRLGADLAVTDVVEVVAGAWDEAAAIHPGLAARDDAPFMARSPDGRWWATGERQGISVLIFDDLDPDGPPLRLPGHTSRVNDGLFDAAGRLYTSSWDGTVRVWDVDGFELLAVLDAHRGRIKEMALVQGRLLTFDWNGEARWWDVSALDMPPTEALSAARARTGLRLGADAEPTFVWSARE